MNIYIYFLRYKNEDDKFYLLHPCKNVPSLALGLSVKNKLYLLDINKGQLVCELENPLDIEPIKSNELSFGSRNKTLFVKCEFN